MQPLQTSQPARSISNPLATACASRRAAPRACTVQMVVRVAARDAANACGALNRMPGSAPGAHIIDIDRRRNLACLHVELERARVGEAMSLLIHTVSSAEFGTIRRLERN